MNEELINLANETEMILNSLDKKMRRAAELFEELDDYFFNPEEDE